MTIPHTTVGSPTPSAHATEAMSIESVEASADHAKGEAADIASQSDTPTAEELEEESLQEAALAIPDSDALSVSSLHTTSSDRAADFTDEVNVVARESDTQHRLDWAHMLGLSGHSLSAANSATSLGFAAARQTTAFSLNIAKRITQGVVALPAMALDGAVMGTAPSQRSFQESGNSTPTFAEVAHRAVGGVFDVISTLALGGIDVGGAITGASLGAAASGVEGVRRALGSEVLKSLGAFSRLVKREWNSDSDTLPPGGIPAYSILGVTQALTAWVCIQMVTREFYEAKMLRHLQPIDVVELHRTIQKEKEEEADRVKQASEGEADAKAQGKKEDTYREETPGASSKAVDLKQKKQVRILEEKTLPDGEGEVIGAEIGRREEPAASTSIATNMSTSAPPQSQMDKISPTRQLPQPLTNQEAIQGLKRYSKLVLGVYGGVALAWLGSLPPDLAQAAGSVVDGQTPLVPRSSSQPEPLLSHSGHRARAFDDEADFLRAAASLDLEDGELIDDEMEDDGVLVIAKGTPSPSGMPGGFDHSSGAGKATPTPRAPNAGTSSSTTQTSDVLFSNDADAGPASKAQLQREPSSSAITTAPQATRPTPSYSYIDLLTGQADVDLFHQLGGLEHGAAVEGNYDETASQAGSAAQMMARASRRVALPSKPRYYVVTDHGNKKIILVLRGSLTLGDIAIDLTCESANFDINDDDEANYSHPATFEDIDEEGPEPAQDFSLEAMRDREAKAIAEAEQKRNEPQSRPHERGQYIVHEGMYETAKEIGGPNRPVHRAVRHALLTNPGYNLDIAGHSLGAGVAAILAVMWASTETCLTVPRSGLPVGRRVHAFSFAVPCVFGDKLGKKAEKLVTSYCHTYDLVCRLSLGAILDIRNACAWLAYENNQSATPQQRAQQQQQQDSTSSTSPHPASASGLSHPIRLINVMQQAFRHQSGQLDRNERSKNDLEADFLALRKTLEANMRHVELYPPGVVLYSLEKEDISPNLARNIDPGSVTSKGHYLFRLKDDANRDEIFGQIIFGRGMLTKHMPDVYHNALDAL